MSVFERVKNAKSPQDALAAIGHGIDHICTRLDKLENVDHTDDPWGRWESNEPEPDENEAAAVREAAARRVIELQERRKSLSDEDDLRAIDAEIGLAKDELREIKSVEDGPAPRASVVEVVGGEVTINLPPASPERKQKRRELAEAIQLEESIEGVSAEDYAKGGPLWLYYGNRDFVKAMPPDIIMTMVLDVNEDDPIEAALMSRDLLKYDDVEGPDVALGRIHGD